jgi:MoaA/NifB/PqqE/SkfB family radical SAM enzyme
MRKYKEGRMIARGLKSNQHPILVHLVPIRRCNLSCTYCNEFDDFSQPVPKEVLKRRIDLLAAMKPENIHISGGEPLMHPDIEEIIAYISAKGILSGLLTNGYLLTRELIQKLNNAGLDYLQISVDNVTPDDVSKKSLKVLDKKLQWLSEFAEFNVSINSVLGADLEHPEDALAVMNRAAELGLRTTIGILHDHSGQVKPFGDQQIRIYRELREKSEKSFASVAYYQQFQENLIQGRPNQWHCGAGARYLYVCEDGLVHYCSQQRGYPAIPLEQYDRGCMEREYKKIKPCAPYCTISCVHRVAMIDHLREKPMEALTGFFPPKQGQDQYSGMPVTVRILAWIFLSPDRVDGKRFLRKATEKFFGVR